MGVNNDKHCVTDNSVESVLRSWEASKAYPAFVSHFDKSRPLSVGRPTVIGSGNKAGILDPYKPYMMWHSEPVSEGHRGEIRNIDFVIDCLMLPREKQPTVLFIHLDGIDQAGHKYGWGSEEQWRAIGQVDEQVGRVLQALDLTNWNTLLIATADHGGHDKEHGHVELTDSCIPFLTNATLGPISRERREEPRQFDACTTVCTFMGFPTDGQDGHNWFS